MFARRSLIAVRSFFAALRGAGAPAGPLGEGKIAMAFGRYDEAEAAFSAALALAATPAQKANAHNKRGVAYAAAHRREDALEAFASALDHDDAFAPALVNVGNVLFEGGHTLDAIDYYRAAIASDQTYALAYRNLGIALRKLGRRAESVSALRKADRLETRPRRSRA